jgi:hypothetical protein
MELQFKLTKYEVEQIVKDKVADLLGMNLELEFSAYATMESDGSITIKAYHSDLKKVTSD